jgi:hypothetical protein
VIQQAKTLFVSAMKYAAEQRKPQRETALTPPCENNTIDEERTPVKPKPKVRNNLNAHSFTYFVLIFESLLFADNKAKSC